MAYAAVISLKQTTHRFLNSSHTLIVSSSGRELLEFAHRQTTSLQIFLKEFYDNNSKRWNSLDVKIRDAVQEVEDALEFNVSNHFLPSLPHGGLDFEEARQMIYSFHEATEKMKDEYITELENASTVEDEDDDDDDDPAVSSNNDAGVKMVGLSKEIAEIKDHLLKPLRPHDFEVFSLVGKVGSCRTIAAKNLFDELFVGKEQPFGCGAWVTIGRNYDYTEILVNILAQIDVHDQFPTLENDVEKLGFYLYESLKGRRYMIVVDDIDEVEVWGYLRKFFPEQDNGSLIVLTTGITEVAQFANSFYIYEIATFLNDHHAWDYLRTMMFGNEMRIHPEFEKAGMKIAENCRGSRIALARVLLFLYKVEKTPECWNKLAAEQQNPIFIVEDEISEVFKIKEDVQKADEKFRATSLVDLSPAIKIIKEYLFPQRYFPKSEIILFYGMAGIGKSTLIKNILEDSSILHRYDHQVWVPLGPKYASEEILVDILTQIYPDINREHVKEDKKLAADLCAE